MSYGRRWAAAVSILLLAACQSKADSERMKLVHRLRDARPAARIVAIQQLAPHANREETAAIVRSAADASADVRKVVALSLAKVDADNAVDLAATMLRDPSDEVRAAAVSTLAGRGGPRAMAYLANAYASGGPFMRAAVQAAGPDVLAKAVQAEARSWSDELEKRKHDKLDQVQLDAVRDLAVSGSPEALAELQTRLVDPNPVFAAAACLGLADAGVKSAVPQIIAAMKGGRLKVTQACAAALIALEPATAVDVIEPLIGVDESTPALLTVLEGVNLTSRAAEKICSIAQSSPDPFVALRAAKLVGANCTGTTPGNEKWKPAETLAVMAALEHKSPDSLKQARTMLASEDASAAAASASYLGAVGSPQDGALLVKTALTELSALDAARAEAAQKAQDIRQAMTTRKDQEEQILKSVLGAKYEAIRRQRPKGPEDVLARLKRTSGPDVASVFEHRPGAIEFIIAATAAAARLKADMKPISDGIYAEQDPRLRQLELELAEFMAEKGSLLRERLRTSSDVDYQLGQLLSDLRKNRETSIEQALLLAKAGSPEDRVELAEALAPSGAKVSPVLLDLARLEEPSLPVIIPPLASVPGAEVDRMLLDRLEDPRGLGTVEAIEALTKRENPAIDSALVHAAVHPLPSVRAAALRALAGRKACAVAPSVRGLAGDYVGSVRSAALSLQGTCSAPATTP